MEDRRFECCETGATAITATPTPGNWRLAGYRQQRRHSRAAVATTNLALQGKYHFSKNTQIFRQLGSIIGAPGRSATCHIPSPTFPLQALAAYARVTTLLRLAAESPAALLVAQSVQFAASLLFVGLYVWGTYSTPARGSVRYYLELALCVVFGAEYMHRLCMGHTDPASRFRMVRTSLIIP